MQTITRVTATEVGGNEFDVSVELERAIIAMAIDHFQNKRVGFEPTHLNEIGTRMTDSRAHSIVRRFAYSHFFENIQEQAGNIALGRPTSVVRDTIVAFLKYNFEYDGTRFK